MWRFVLRGAKLKIFIDADGCPVTRIVVEIAKKENIECIVVCDTSHSFDFENARTLTVDKGSDSADFKIANMISQNDIVVTQDYGLARMCLSHKACPINQNGMRYTDKNIDSLLMSRYVSKKIRESSKRIKGPKKRNSENDEIFIREFIKLINEIKTNEKGD